MGNALSQVIREAFVRNRKFEKLEGPLLPSVNGPLNPQTELSSFNNADRTATFAERETNAENDLIQKLMCCVFKGQTNLNKKMKEQLKKLSRPKTSTESIATERTYRNLTLLSGTTTPDEHFETIKIFVAKARTLKGLEGLNELGFDYKKTLDKNIDNIIDTIDTSDSDKEEPQASSFQLENESDLEAGIHDNDIAHDIMQDTINSEIRASLSTPSLTSDDESSGASPCDYCNQRLYHLPSNSPITEENRKRFIADGEMYEQIARLCQEAAQEIMISQGNLEWVTICDDQTLGSEHLRALVSKRYFDQDVTYSDSGDRLKINNDTNTVKTYSKIKTLLIITGKGKVRAGIFSRQHLITSGLEESTAITFVREAKEKHMNIMIFDPNARGDRNGMQSIEKSINKLLPPYFDTSFEHQYRADKSIYVLAHSQGGAQLVRYLREKERSYLIPKIGSIAFTDSTHNIQWVKENHDMFKLLESESCIYLKSSNPYHDDDWEKRVAGEIVDTDHYWEHRFGKIKTLWAGTKEHSLTNWIGRHCIWDHFCQSNRLDSHCDQSHDQQLNKEQILHEDAVIV